MLTPLSTYVSDGFPEGAERRVYVVGRGSCTKTRDEPSASVSNPGTTLPVGLSLAPARAERTRGCAPFDGCTVHP